MDPLWLFLAFCSLLQRFCFIFVFSNQSFIKFTSLTHAQMPRSKMRMQKTTHKAKRSAEFLPLIVCAAHIRVTAHPAFIGHLFLPVLSAARRRSIYIYIYLFFVCFVRYLLFRANGLAGGTISPQHHKIARKNTP